MSFLWPFYDPASFIPRVHSKNFKSISSSNWSIKKWARTSPWNRYEMFSKMMLSNIFRCAIWKVVVFCTLIVAVSVFIIIIITNQSYQSKSILICVSLENWKPSRVSTHDIFRAVQLSLHAAMAEPMTQVSERLKRIKIKLKKNNRKG